MISVHQRTAIRRHSRAPGIVTRQRRQKWQPQPAAPDRRPTLRPASSESAVLSSVWSIHAPVVRGSSVARPIAQTGPHSATISDANDLVNPSIPRINVINDCARPSSNPRDCAASAFAYLTKQRLRQASVVCPATAKQSPTPWSVTPETWPVSRGNVHEQKDSDKHCTL